MGKNRPAGVNFFWNEPADFWTSVSRSFIQTARVDHHPLFPLNMSSSHCEEGGELQRCRAELASCREQLAVLQQQQQQQLAVCRFVCVVLSRRQSTSMQSISMQSTSMQSTSMQSTSMQSISIPRLFTHFPPPLSQLGSYRHHC